ncbi:MAG: hypothetical protein WDZ96_02870 [Acidimicrobiia bacterium]
MASTDVDSTSVETRAEILAALADPVRLRIVDLLARIRRPSCKALETRTAEALDSLRLEAPIKKETDWPRTT